MLLSNPVTFTRSDFTLVYMEVKSCKWAVSAITLVFLAFPAMAQGKDDVIDCKISGTEITTLRDPLFGGPNVWDMKDGGDGMDVFADIIPLENGHFVVGGSYTKDKKDNVFRPVITRYDERYKKVWDTRPVSTEHKTVQRVVKTKAGFAALGDVRDAERGQGFYIAHLDDKGKVTGETPFFEDGGHLESKSLVLSSDDTGFIIAAQFTDAKDDQKQYGLIYKIASDGKIIWKRAYRPGPTTVFQTLKPTIKGQYIVVGQIVTGGNKSAGWAMRVDNDGAIGWQQTYPRGLAATLYGASEFLDGSFVLAGKIRPLAGENSGMAAWVMKVSSTGKPIWQRYFKSEFYDYSGGDSVVYEDGRASVLISGASINKDYRSYARLMTFAPSGVVMDAIDYTDGQNATPLRLVSGFAAERILAGYAQTSFGDDPAADEAAPAYTYDGWVVAAPAPEIYDDPCAKPQPKSPILR